MKQVRENLESQRLQYALAERARKVGFAEVEVIDSDLGVSAAIGSERKGLQKRQYAGGILPGSIENADHAATVIT